MVSATDGLTTETDESDGFFILEQGTELHVEQDSNGMVRLWWATGSQAELYSADSVRGSYEPANLQVQQENDRFFVLVSPEESRKYYQLRLPQ